MEVFILLMAVVLAMVAGALAWNAFELAKKLRLLNHQLDYLQKAFDDIAEEVGPVVISADKIGELSKQTKEHWLSISRPKSSELTPDIPGWQPVAEGFLDMIGVAIQQINQRRDS